jgi:copper chaperone CopZ
MQQTFQVENVKCGGCASTLKSKLLEEYGEVEVNLETMPREITLELHDSKLDSLRAALRRLGYPMSDENLNLFETGTTKAKSFVSCAVGKVDNFSKQ